MDPQVTLSRQLRSPGGKSQGPGEVGEDMGWGSRRLGGQGCPQAPREGWGGDGEKPPISGPLAHARGLFQGSTGHLPPGCGLQCLKAPQVTPWASAS